MKAGRWEEEAGLKSRAAASIGAVTAAGVETYVRQRHLARVLPVGPDEIADESVAGRRRIVARLARALRAERNRGRGGHWTYDLNRHIALRQAYLAERRWLVSREPHGARIKTAGSGAPGG
jgi:hypothetical protein